ncbi:hypothetical protein ACFX13_021924 [Malus domestica]
MKDHRARGFRASQGRAASSITGYMMQKDQRLNMDEAKNKLKQAGVPKDENAALKRQFAPLANDTTTKDSSRIGFMNAGAIQQTDGGIKVTANPEDIELPEENDSENDERVEIQIAQKEVLDAVFGELAKKRKEAEKNEDRYANTKDEGTPFNI